MPLQLRNYTLCAIVIIILSGCTSTLLVNTQPPATAIFAISTPSPTATSFPPTVGPTTIPLPSPTSTSTPLIPSLAQDFSFVFIGETIPDGTNLQPGQKFKKTWTLKNNGNAIWDQGVVLARTSSFPVKETLGSPDQIPLSKKVEPGASIEIEVDLVVPNQNGQFTVFYQLQNRTGLPVPNSQIWVAITVGNLPLPGSGSVTARLVSVSMQNAEFTVYFCMQVPDGRQWYPWGLTLLANQHRYAPTGSRIDPAGATTANKCFSVTTQP